MKKTLYLSLIAMMLAIADVQSAKVVDEAGESVARNISKNEELNEQIKALKSAGQEKLIADSEKKEKILDQLEMSIRDVYATLQDGKQDSFFTLLLNAVDASPEAWSKYCNNICGDIGQIYIEEKDNNSDLALLCLLLFRETEHSKIQWIFSEGTDGLWGILSGTIQLKEALSKTLFKGFPTNISLTFNNCSDESGVGEIASVLGKDSIVSELSITQSKVKIATILAKLKENKSLKVLNLSGNGINDDGAKVIAEFIKNNPNLVKLDLSNNEIGDEGSEAIGEALKENYCLISVDLSGNKIGNAGVKAISKGVNENKGLIDLDLSGNKDEVSDTVIDKIFSSEKWLREKGRLSRSPSPSPSLSPMPVAS